MSGHLDLPFRREFKDKPSSHGQQVWKAHAPHPSREVGGVENGGRRQLAARCHVQVWRFDVENDDDVRDAVVADDGGGGERADVDDGDESSGTRKDVEPHQRLRWNRRKEEREAEKKVCLKLASRISALL